jgi:hypothetical protein
MVGTSHTDLAAYMAMLSESARLGALMREYLTTIVTALGGHGMTLSFGFAEAAVRQMLG